MKKLFCIILLIVISACSNKNKDTNFFLDSFIGTTESDIVKTLGAPYNTNNISELEWDKINEKYYYPKKIITYHRYSSQKPFVIYTLDFPEGIIFLDKYTTINFFIDHGRVQSWSASREDE